MQMMCLNDELKGNFTNLSGTHTCATALFQGGMDEQEICRRTGHRSIVVREYKVPSVTKKNKFPPYWNPLV